MIRLTFPGFAQILFDTNAKTFLEIPSIEKPSVMASHKNNNVNKQSAET